MCSVKQPKVQQTKTPDPAIIRNPYLDGVDPVTAALRKGRSSLRINRGPMGATSSVPQTGNVIAAPSSPVQGGGTYSGGSASLNKSLYLSRK